MNRRWVPNSRPRLLAWVLGLTFLGIWALATAVLAPLLPGPHLMANVLALVIPMSVVLYYASKVPSGIWLMSDKLVLRFLLMKKTIEFDDIVRVEFRTDASRFERRPPERTPYFIDIYADDGGKRMRIIADGVVSGAVARAIRDETTKLLLFKGNSLVKEGRGSDIVSGALREDA